MVRKRITYYLTKHHVIASNGENIGNEPIVKFASPVLRALRLQLRGIKHTLWSNRKLHVYCVGAPKTGTHSLAAMFAHYYRSDHEPGGGAGNPVESAASRADIPLRKVRRSATGR